MRKMIGTTSIAAALFALLAVISAPVARAMPLPAGFWLGPEGTPLPFHDEEEVLDFLRSAEIVAKKKLSGGINKPLKLTLERDGVRANAIFRTVNVEKTNLHNAAAHARGFRDSYIFEVAAFELGRLLGLRSVPPATLREIGGQHGSIQLWVEQAMTEAERIERGLAPRSPSSWQLQKHNMAVFDNLIYNFDRNHGNMLMDDTGKLWFVDHTRSFKRLPMLASAQRVRFCERELFHRLRYLDKQEVREVLKPYLRPVEISALLARHRQILERLESLVAEHGEGAILFEAGAGRTRLAGL